MEDNKEILDSAWIEEVVANHDKENQIVKFVNATNESASKAGQNHTSTIQRVKMEVVLASGRRSRRSVIVKNELKGTFEDKISSFKSEIMIYKSVLSEMEVLMADFNDNRDRLWCEMIGCKLDNTIVFEDLSISGYVVPDKTNYLDFDHTTLVMESIGRFHAMSKILLDTSVQIDPRPCVLASDFPFINNFIRSSLQLCAQSMISFWPAEWKQLGEKLLKEAEVVSKKLKDLADFKDEDQFIVLNHGDIWTCNCMFKYFKGQPISLKFIDFQEYNTSSYMWDVVYTMFTSVRPDVRRQHFHYFLELYWKSLENTLLFFGFGGKIPTLDDVKKEADRLAYFSFVMLATFHPCMTSDSAVDLDVDQMCSPSADHTKLNLGPFKEFKFIVNTQDDFRDFIKKCVI